MKLPDFGDVLKQGKWFLLGITKVSSVLQELKFEPKFLGYLTSHR
jgi:hypothetical protein